MALRVAYEDPEQLLAWATQTTGMTYRSDAQVIGLRDDEATRAAVIFDTFSPWDVQVHVVATDTAGPTWITDEFIRHCAAYPFITCKYDRVTATISIRNRPALVLAGYMGFKREGIARRSGPDRCDFVLLGLLREECRFLPPLVRYRQSTKAAI